MTDTLTREEILGLKSLYLRNLADMAGKNNHAEKICQMNIAVCDLALKALDPPAPPSADVVEIMRKVLTDHWLAAMICDHKNETDKAICSCSRVNLPVMKSVGESAATWVEHVIGELKNALGWKEPQ